MNKTAETPKTAEMSKTPNYAKDKQGWVNFQGGRKKIKLRKYVYDIAQLLNNANKKGFNYNREKLVECYNIDGLKGIHAAAKVLVEETKQPKIDEKTDFNA